MLIGLVASSASSIYTLMIQARSWRESHMRRRMIVIASLIAVAAVVLALAISPTLYHGQTSASITSTGAVQTEQCRKVDPDTKYPLILQIWNPAGDPVKGAWIVLVDSDRGIPYEEGYIRDDGTYRTKHTYSPSLKMSLLVQNDETVEGFQNYAAEVLIPDVVCEDSYIHVQVNAS
jgi:hypothetical protein